MKYQWNIPQTTHIFLQLTQTIIASNWNVAHLLPTSYHITYHLLLSSTYLLANTCCSFQLLLSKSRICSPLYQIYPLESYHIYAHTHNLVTNEQLFWEEDHCNISSGHSGREKKATFVSTPQWFALFSTRFFFFFFSALFHFSHHFIHNDPHRHFVSFELLIHSY